MDIVQSIKTKDVVAYATLPRVVPRLKNLFSSGFGYVAFLMGQMYGSVRLLPPNHPYLQAKNIGRFGIHHVLVEASSQLRFKKENIDQIFIFFAMLACVLILIAQFAFLAYSLLIGPVMAFTLFDTPTPEVDIAWTILDSVFGVPGVFCSSQAPFTCTDYSTNADYNGGAFSGPNIPLPYHLALQALFEFYSTALLLIGTLIFLYFIFVLILETAVTGVPFGQRFQNVWVPVRLVVAVGMLLPVNWGLNSAQYITLYTAKFGSSMATVGWNDFNRAIGQHPAFGGAAATDGMPIGERYSYLAIPEQTDISPLVRAMSMVHACAFAYLRMNSVPAGAATVAGQTWNIDIDYTVPGNNFMIRPYLVKNLSAWMSGAPAFPVPVNNAERQVITGTATPDYLQAIGFYYGGDIIIRFGEYKLNNVGNPVYTAEEGQVASLCGDIRVPVVDLSDPGSAFTQGGVDYMIQYYYGLVLNMWFNDNDMKQFARTYVTLVANDRTQIQTLCASGALSGCGTAGFQTCGGCTAPTACCETTLPDSSWRSANISQAPAGYQITQNQAVRIAWSLLARNGTTKMMENQIMIRGWAGAGIWYNKIAELNGAFFNGVASIPTMDKFPLVMEQVRQVRMRRDNSAFSEQDMYKPSINPGSGNDSPNISIGRGDQELREVGVPLYAVQQYWGDRSDPEKEEEIENGNLFIYVVNFILGTSGIASIRGANAHLHPLAQLVAVGKGLVDRTVQNLAGSTVATFLGGILKANRQTQGIAAAAEMVSGLLEITAFVGLTAGFVLFYVLPFLPFVYFFFAVGSWVKAIFEAMVGVPLWALAHLRIDGDGLPGDAASNGYFLLLEIFIRPILTVVGLIAAISVFAAQVRVLNLIWDLVVSNATGFADNDILTSLTPTNVNFKRDAVDQFFFTIVYTIICYMLAIASFKLIDKIPDNILRFAGAGVSSFGDIDQDHVESLNRYAATGGMTIGGQATSAIRGGASGLGRTLGDLVASEKGSATS